MLWKINPDFDKFFLIHKQRDMCRNGSSSNPIFLDAHFPEINLGWSIERAIEFFLHLSVWKSSRVDHEETACRRPKNVQKVNDHPTKKLYTMLDGKEEFFNPLSALSSSSRPSDIRCTCEKDQLFHLFPTLTLHPTNSALYLDLLPVCSIFPYFTCLAFFSSGLGPSVYLILCVSLLLLKERNNAKQSPMHSLLSPLPLCSLLFTVSSSFISPQDPRMSLGSFFFFFHLEQLAYEMLLCHYGVWCVGNTMYGGFLGHINGVVGLPFQALIPV